MEIILVFSPRLLLLIYFFGLCMGRSPSIVGLATNSARGLSSLSIIPSFCGRIRYKENGPDQAPDLGTSNLVIFDHPFHGIFADRRSFATLPVLAGQNCSPLRNSALPSSGGHPPGHLASCISDLFFTSTGTRGTRRQRFVFVAP